MRSHGIEPDDHILEGCDTKIKTVMIDVREEVDFNLFHILDARHVPLAEISNPEFISELHFEPANTVFVLMSNDEAAATEAWKVAEGCTEENIAAMDR